MTISNNLNDFITRAAAIESICGSCKIIKTNKEKCLYKHPCQTMNNLLNANGIGFCRDCNWYEINTGYCTQLNHCMGLSEFCSRWKSNNKYVKNN